MKELTRKIVLILLIIIFSINIHIKTFADSNEWIDAYQSADSVAEFVLDKDLTLDKLKKAFDKGMITNLWIDECYSALKESKYFSKFIDVYWEGCQESKKSESTFKTYVENSAKAMGLKDKKEIEKLFRYVKTYMTLDGMKKDFEDYIEKERPETSSLNSDDKKVKEYMNYTAREMVEQFVKDGHSISGIKNSTNGTKILNEWYEVIVVENRSAGTGKISKNICSEEHSYADDRNNLKTFLENWKKKQEIEEQNPIYVNPEKNPDANSAEGSIDDMILDGEKFIKSGDDIKYTTESLQKFSKTFYNILLAAGIFAAVIVGAILGIKFMTASVEGQAEVKKQLITYVVGCVVVFGGFGIWKLVVTILEGL